MARMLGRHQVPGCCPGAREGLPGTDCCGGHRMGTRAAKRAEDRVAEREFASLASWYETGEGRAWIERSQAAAENWPLWDLSDCQHGCNGLCLVSGSESCDFTCHEGLSVSDFAQYADGRPREPPSKTPSDL